MASLPGFSDVWQIDVGVCLLAPSSGTVCNGNGQPDLFNVVCNCVAGTSGRYCEVGSPSSNGVIGSGASGPAVAVGVSISVIIALAAGGWFFVTRLGGTIPGLSELSSLAARLSGGGGGGSRFAPRSYLPSSPSQEKASFITSGGAGASASVSVVGVGYGAM